MYSKRFWALIEDSRRVAHGNIDAQIEALESKLEQQPADEIVGFHRELWEQMGRSYRWDLWGAAYIIKGGCSDDGFDYFRGWLIAQGEAVFEAALADPESLTEIAEPDVECEDMLGVAWNVYKRKTGKQLLSSPGKRAEIQGEPWEEEYVERLFPKLAAKFG